MNGWRISKSGQQPFENSLQQRAESALTGAAAHHTSISIHPSIHSSSSESGVFQRFVFCAAALSEHITNDAGRNPSIGRTEEPLRAMMRRTKREKTGCAVVQRCIVVHRAADLGAPSHWILAHCDAARRLCCMRAEWAPNRGGGVSERIALRTMCLRIGLQRQQNLPPHCVMRKIFGVGARQQIAPRGSRFWYVRVYLCVRDDFFPHNRFEPSSPGHSFRSVDFCVSQHEILCVLSLWTAKALAFNYASLDCAYFIVN